MKEKTNIQLASYDACTGCAACASACPKGCITMNEDKEGFLQPHIDADACIGCHQCEKSCPIVSPVIIPTDFETQAYAAINKDEDVRMHSSSGGVFHALAKWVIEQDGVVFGARWDETWEVMHDYAEDMVGVKSFMQSKYVQSRIGNTYQQAKQFLNQSRWVLFSGTPCQLGGLRAYLGKEYEKLLQVDLICHGVPSPGVWRRYKKEYLPKGEILCINMRDKTDGWLGFQCLTTTTTMREQQKANPYFRGFLNDVYLRRSCYACHYKQLHRSTDLTLADFWGVEKIRPDIFTDNKGVSLAFAHSKQGKEILQSLDLSMVCLLPDEALAAIESNPSMTHSVAMPDSRSTYFALFRWLGFRRIEYLLTKKPYYIRVKRKLKKILKKL